MIAAVEQCDLHRSLRESTRGLEAAESTSDDHDLRSLHCGRGILGRLLFIVGDMSNRHAMAISIALHGCGVELLGFPRLVRIAINSPPRQPSF
jgi:hypothetical protein